jgi:Flp pilus assembly protein TadG
MKRISHRRHREKGTQVVELALVLPLMMFLSLMVSEGAGLMRAHQVLNNAAREGARVSTVQENQNHPEVAQEAAVAYAANNYLTITAANVAVDQNIVTMSPSGTAMTCSRVTVTMPYTLQYMPALPWFEVDDTFNLSGAAEFRNFY